MSTPLYQGAIRVSIKMSFNVLVAGSAGYFSEMGVTFALPPPFPESPFRDGVFGLLPFLLHCLDLGFTTKM